MRGSKQLVQKNEIIGDMQKGGDEESVKTRRRKGMQEFRVENKRNIYRRRGRQERARDFARAEKAFDAQIILLAQKKGELNQ